MALVIKLEKIMGAIMMHRPQQMIMQAYMAICRHTFIGMICISISNGFIVSLILPSGGGQKGSVFYSSRPSPYGYYSASSLVSMWIEIKISPRVLMLPVSGSS